MAESTSSERSDGKPNAADDEVFVAIRRARLGLADLVAGLNSDQLATPSLCAGWSVRDVVGHLVLASDLPKARLFAAVVRARGSYDRAMDRLSRAEATRPFPDLVANLRANADSRFAVAGVGPRGPLTDVLVHTVDIAVPLRLSWSAPSDAVRVSVEFATSSRARAFVPRGRLSGLRLHASDLGFTWGQGATVNGSGIDLLAVLCGRAALLERLDGPGTDVLASRTLGTITSGRRPDGD